LRSGVLVFLRFFPVDHRTHVDFLHDVSFDNVIIRNWL